MKNKFPVVSGITRVPTYSGGQSGQNGVSVLIGLNPPAPLKGGIPIFNFGCGNEENRVFNHSGLIFYCYLLILVNELRVYILKSICYKSKKMKTLLYQSKIVKKGVFGNLSIGKQWKWGFQR